MKHEGGGASGPTYEELEDALQEHEGGCTKGGGGSRPTTDRGIKRRVEQAQSWQRLFGANGGDRHPPPGNLKDDIKKHELRGGYGSSRVAEARGVR